MWYKGYLHYHTSFHYSEKERITPEELSDDLRQLGGSFVFCAGDHGDANGDNYWGWDEEFPEYKQLCLSKSKDGIFLFIPALEIHLNFPPFNSRQEHHSCVPTLDYLPPLKPAEEKALAVSYTPEVEKFIEDAHKNNLSLTLNHPYFSCHSLFGGPLPLSIPALYKIDYFELFTSNNFLWDFSTYLKFLQSPISSRMGICSGIDNAGTVCLPLSSQPNSINSTYLYVEGEFNHKNLMNSWNQRNSYAVRGNLYLKKINPIPGKEYIKTTDKVKIELEVKNAGKKIIQKIEIYKNGNKIYEKEVNQKTFSFLWQDDENKAEKSSYILHIEAEDEHLITSPINYF